jgi:hypothetical protein
MKPRRYYLGLIQVFMELSNEVFLFFLMSLFVCCSGRKRCQFFRVLSRPRGTKLYKYIKKRRYIYATKDFVPFLVCFAWTRFCTQPRLGPSISSLIMNLKKYGYFDPPSFLSIAFLFLHCSMAGLCSDGFARRDRSPVNLNRKHCKTSVKAIQYQL